MASHPGQNEASLPQSEPPPSADGQDPEKIRQPPPAPTHTATHTAKRSSQVSIDALENAHSPGPGSPHHGPPAPDELALALSRSLHSHASRASRLPPVSHSIADPDPEAAGGDGEESVYEADKLPYSKLRCLALVLTVTGASFSNSVVIILPSIGREIGIPDSRLQWVVSAYSLTFGCFLLLWGRIADVFGKKAIFVLGSAWVTATTVANPFVPNEIAFHLFRGLQGLGAAANVPTAIGILGTTFPPGKAKTYAFTAYGAGAPLGSIFGNVIAGLITSYSSWKWVFGVLAILIGIITVAGFLVIPNHPPPHHGPVPLSPTSNAAATNSSDAPQPIEAAWFSSIDWLGAFLVTLGLVGLLFALTEGNVVGWSTPWVGVIIGLSVLLVAAFVLWQLWLEKPPNCEKRAAGHPWPPPPLLRMSIFTHSTGNSFATSLIIMALFFSSFNGYLIYSTYFYQDYQGLSAIQTTLRFIPTGVFGLITSFCVAPLLSRVPTYMILLTGNVAVSLSSLLLAVPIPATTSYFAYGLWAMILSVIGADTAWPSLTLFVSRALPREDQALGGALVNMAGQVGRAIGLAIATAIQTAVMASERGLSVADVGAVEHHEWATLKGIRAGNWFNFATGVASLLVVAIAFRGTGIVGKAPDRPARSGVRSGDGTTTTATPARVSSDAEAPARVARVEMSAEGK